MAQCPTRAPKTPLPPSFEIDKAQTHPYWKHALEPTAQCELEAGHGEGADEYDVERRHRNGELVWWDPPIIMVGGEPIVRSSRPFTLFGETVA